MHLKHITMFKPTNEAEILEMKVEIFHLRFMDTVRQLMQQREMTQSELAQRLGTTKGYVSQLFSGDKILNLKRIVQLQAIFDVHFGIEIL